MVIAEAPGAYAGEVGDPCGMSSLSMTGALGCRRWVGAEALEHAALSNGEPMRGLFEILVLLLGLTFGTQSADPRIAS